MGRPPSTRPPSTSFVVLMLAVALTVTATIAARAAAQSSAPSGAGEAPFWATVTTDDVYVRSAPSVESSYPFSQVKAGDLVRVLEESFGWAKIEITGPTFRGAYGYIRADRRVTLSPDGRTAEVTSRTDVFAPNMSARGNPDSSWKSIARVDPGRTLVILETLEGQRDTVYKVALPATATGWINRTFLRRATPEELVRAGLQVKPAPPTTAPDTTPPTTPPASGDAATPAANEPTTAAPSDPTITPADDAPDGSAPPEEEIVETTETLTVAPGGLVETETVTAPSTPADVDAAVRRIALADLEAAFKVLQSADPGSAEVGALRERYLEYAARPGTPANEREFAFARAEQLELRVEVQERLQRLRRMMARNEVETDGVRAIIVAAENRQAYAVVGRLNASQVYDGERLPLLFRVQDPGGGQTMAYVAPSADFEMYPLLGQLVGVVGTARYDDALRVNVVDTTRIDVLTSAR